jgi:predicted amidohydrolase YtcJ
MPLQHFLKNAKIHTLWNDYPFATTLHFFDGKVLGVDETPPARNVLVEDMQGGIIIPGLTDAHIHWEWTALNLKRIDVMELRSKRESVERVRAAASGAQPGRWLTGFGWSQGIWEDTGGDFPCAADLDAVAPNNPVYLSSRSGHAAWLNSAALKEAGIDDTTADPPGGSIQRDAKGKPTGILFEEAMALADRAVPQPLPEEIAAAMEEAQELAWRTGLTGIHDFDRPPAMEAMQLLLQRGTLGLRVLKNINDPFIHHAHGLRVRWGFGNDWLRIGGLKMFADGAIGALTARMLEPYAGQPDNRGIEVMPKDRMLELALEATYLGLPSTIHAIGDEAVRTVLDVLEEVRRAEEKKGIPRVDRRHRIEHVQCVHKDDVKRLAELDIIASMQPIHATADYPVADRYWGDRCALSYNPRVQIDAGARVAFGSDSPVEPFDPMKGIHAAVTRRRADGSPGPDGWYPDARLTVNEAILGYTQGPAWAAGMKDRLGVLRPGALADLVVLDRDPFTIPPDDLLNVRVLGTMVGGKWRYRAEDFFPQGTEF